MELLSQAFIRVHFFMLNNTIYSPINLTHMKTNNANDAVARDAAEWYAKQQKETERRNQEKQNRLQQEKEMEERQKNAHMHPKIMAAFSQSMYRTSFIECVEDPCWPHTDLNIYNCQKEYPSQEVLKLLMERENHEEIMAMIKAYNEEPPQSNGTNIYQGDTSPLYMPEYLQTFIAQRGNMEEIQAFCSKHGFNAIGQEILLARGNHAELMWYLKHHGLLPTQQKMLIARGNSDEIHTHIRHHGLAPELLDMLMTELAIGKTDNFYKFIALSEFPIKYQERLLEVAKEDEFLAYMNRYGFWEEVLPKLAAKRSETELTAYIHKHHYLGRGVYELALRGFRSVNLLYQEQPTCNTVLFIDALTQAPNTDYETLSKLYLSIEMPRYLHPKEEKAIALFQTGTHNDVMAFLKQEKPELCLYGEAALFFRNKPAEYETYLDIKRQYRQKNQINQRNS